MALIRNNQIPQNNPQNGGGMPPQNQQPNQQKTVFQKAIWREKWIIVYCAIMFIIGTLQAIFSDKETIASVIQSVGIQLVLFTILNFTLVPWILTIFYRSKQASENFWNQKY